MVSKNQLNLKRGEILELASSYGINRIRVFGSVARGEENPESDIDLLVNFNEDSSLFDLIAFKHEVEKLLEQQVDVVSENALHWYIKDKILQEAVEI